MKRLKELGVTLHLGARAKGLSKDKKALEFTDSAGKLSKVACDKVLVTVGRKPVIEGWGREAIPIDMADGFLKIDEQCRTSITGIYAIGDVTGGLQFTHVAGYHAGLVIRAILFRKSAKENRHILPWATFTDPEISNVGYSEAEAREKYKDIRVLRWPYVENDRAQAERKTSGLIKVITDKKGLILGAGIVGAGADEMINTWALAVSQGMKVSAMTGYVSPYPTMGEIGKRASTEFYKPLLQKWWLKKLVSFLRIFG